MEAQIEKIKKFIDSLDGSIDDLHLKLQPIITKSLEEVVSDVQSPLEKIELYNNYSYVLISIIVAYLRSSGVDTTNHPIMKELDRVKLYMKRHKDLITLKDESDAATIQNTKEYLLKTLGTKAVTENTISGQQEPAISSSNFKNTHTRFD